MSDEHPPETTESPVQFLKLEGQDGRAVGILVDSDEDQVTFSVESKGRLIGSVVLPGADAVLSAILTLFPAEEDPGDVTTAPDTAFPPGDRIVR